MQLDELCGIGDEREWKETARWIKYEEDVEEGAERWGRPHVAPLSFHSLLNLRKCLETGKSSIVSLKAIKVFKSFFFINISNQFLLNTVRSLVFGFLGINDYFLLV